MTTITRNHPRTTSSTTPSGSPRRLPASARHAATAVLAVVAHAAGVSLEVGGEPIPPSGFATMTLLAVGSASDSPSPCAAGPATRDRRSSAPRSH